MPKKSDRPIDESIDKVLRDEKELISFERLMKFKEDILNSKIKLMSLINKIKSSGSKIYGISSPSRASTLVNYVGLDGGIIELSNYY